MQIALIHEKGVLTVHLTGEIDHHTAGSLRQQIDTAALGGRCRQMVLDFSSVSFMDSSGVGLILGRYRLMQSLGGQLTLQRVSQRLERMIRLAGLDKLPIWESQSGEE